MSRSEKNCEFYDQIYRWGGSTHPSSKTYKAYLQNPRRSPYYHVWQFILALISKPLLIADFGCGPGQFAQLAVESGHKYSYGVDFSKVAVGMAKARNPKLQSRFYLGDLYDSRCYCFRDYDVAVFAEVLEHIEHDLKVLSSLPAKKKVIFTVPNFASDGHVRVYPDRKSILKRYHKLLSIKKIAPQFLDDNKGVIYICKAVRR